MKKFICYWDERRSVVLEAKNEKEAMEKVHSGDYHRDETAEMNGSVEIQELEV